MTFLCDMFEGLFESCLELISPKSQLGHTFVECELVSIKMLFKEKVYILEFKKIKVLKSATKL